MKPRDTATSQTAPIGDYQIANNGVMTVANGAPSTTVTFENADRLSSRSPDETPLLCIADVLAYTQHITGRLKTLIDGAIADPTQRKALKDLIHAIMWEEHYEPTERWARSVAEGRLPYHCPPFSKTSIAPLEQRYT